MSQDVSHPARQVSQGELMNRGAYLASDMNSIEAEFRQKRRQGCCVDDAMKQVMDILLLSKDMRLRLRSTP